MKDIELSQEFSKKLTSLRNKDKILYQKIKKQLALFQKSPKHHSLRLHRLKGGLKNIWSISVDRNHRIVFIENEYFYFFDFGTHDEVYKK